jgi:hypothetical protein
MSNPADAPGTHNTGQLYEGNDSWIARRGTAGQDVVLTVGFGVAPVIALQLDIAPDNVQTNRQQLFG